MLRQRVQLGTGNMTATLFSYLSLWNPYSRGISHLYLHSWQANFVIFWTSKKKRKKSPNLWQQDVPDTCLQSRVPCGWDYESQLQALADLSVAYRSLNKSLNHNGYVGASTGGRWRSCTHTASLLFWERSSCWTPTLWPWRLTMLCMR